MSRVFTCLGFLVLIATGASRSAHAAGATTDAAASTYVSEQFRAVAKKLVAQYIGESLNDACPGDAVICKQLVSGLVDVLDAAIGGDTARLRLMLSKYFIASAIVGAAAYALGELVEVKSLEKSAEKSLGLDAKRLIQLQAVVTPLATCVLGILRQDRTGCDIPASLEKVFRELDILNPNNADSPRLDAMLKTIAQKTRPQPADVILALEAIASSRWFRRYDIRVYLTSLQIAVKQGLEGGLFEFAEHFVDADVSGLALLQTSPIFGDRDDNTKQAFADAFATCSGGAAAWSAWSTQRTAILGEIRIALQLAEPLPPRLLAPLDAVLAASCQSGDATALKTISDFHRFALFVQGPLYMHQFRTVYAIDALAIAAILDFVRTDDEAQLDAHVRELLAHAADRLGWLACKAKTSPSTDPVAACAASVKSPGSDPQHLPRMTCQGAFLAALLRAQDPLAAVHGQSCYDVETRATCTVFDTKAPSAGSAAGTCHFPELAPVSPAPTGDRAAIDAGRKTAIRALISTLSKDLDGKLDAVADGHAEQFETILRALRYLGADKAPAMRTTLARLAVERLLDHVTDIAERQLGGKPASCESDVHTTSIFSGIGARCAVIALIQAAYYPIADYLWTDGGISSKNASQIADSTYQSLLQSKYLAGSPLLLNVGLGANLIWGDHALWGAHAYRALTVMDKLGVELYRWRSERTTFEVGPFVGGFLDALVRTIGGVDHKFWLAGLALGVPRVHGYDFGFELHAAAALPFSFDSSKEIGFAAGGVLVIPWDFWKEH